MIGIPALLSSMLLCLVLSALGAPAAEKRIALPDGGMIVIVSDGHESC